jgi:hypothetical protein
MYVLPLSMTATVAGNFLSAITAKSAGNLQSNQWQQCFLAYNSWITAQAAAFR